MDIPDQTSGTLARFLRCTRTPGPSQPIVTIPHAHLVAVPKYPATLLDRANVIREQGDRWNAVCAHRSWSTMWCGTYKTANTGSQVARFYCPTCSWIAC